MALKEDSTARQAIRHMIRRINQAIEEMNKYGEMRPMHADEHLEAAIKIGYEIIGPDEIHEPNKCRS